jgi:hypothetical protein
VDEFPPTDDAPAPGRPFFAFADADRSAGWWLSAAPQPQRPFLAAAAKAVPALLTAWTYTAEEPPEPRGGDRIALLAAFRGRFDPDQVADLLGARGG